MCRKLLGLGIILALVLILPAGRAAGRQGNTIVVAYVPGLANDPFYTTLQSGIMQGFADVSANVAFAVWSPDRFSAEVQIPLIEQIVARSDVDYLLIAPADREQLIPALERAYHAGINIITMDTFIGDGDYASGTRDVSAVLYWPG